MFTCPTCNAKTPKLIAPGGCKDGKLVCPNCYQSGKSIFNWQLHDVEFKDGKTRLTKGKSWEIKNRVKSPDDGRTIINKVTGKPAQY
jgi:hypothetical protein